MVERREFFIDNIHKNIENIFKSKLYRIKIQKNTNFIKLTQAEQHHNFALTNSISNLKNMVNLIGKSNPSGNNFNNGFNDTQVA
jgi:hypothetical protein